VNVSEFCGDSIAALAFGHPDLQTSHHPTSACGDFSRKDSIRITDEIFINRNTLLNRLLLVLAHKHLAPSIARTTLNKWMLTITGILDSSVPCILKNTEQHNVRKPDLWGSYRILVGKPEGKRSL
jgi:hypothetical protein